MAEWNAELALKQDFTGGIGTVTSISISPANGFSGTVDDSTTDAVITLTTTTTGLIKGFGGGLVSANAGVDYLAPNGNGGALTNLSYGQFPVLPSNSVLGTAAGGSPSGMMMPSCSATASALIWTAVTGFGCHTISGSSSGITISDGVHTINGVTSLVVTGATAGGSTPNGTLLITGGAPGGSTGNIQANNGTGGFSGLTYHQVTVNLDQFGASQVGIVPQSGGGTTNFLRADGSWAPPGVAGGITFSGSVTVGHCPQIGSSSTLVDAGAPCGGAGGPPTGAAGNGLTGTYPNPGLSSTAVTTITAAAYGDASVTSAPYNAVCNGSTDDSGAFSSALASGFVVYVPKTSTPCAISTTSTWPANAKVVFAPGAAIKVTTGVTLTMLSMIDPNVQTNIFQTAGTGAVIGLRACRPEWFGAARDGSTDDSGAIQKCETAIETAGGSPSMTPAVAMPAMLLSAGTYRVAKTILVTPGPNYMVKWRGNGGNGHDNTGGGAGTIIQAAASFTGTAVIWVTGTTANDASGGEFEMSGFNVVPQTPGSGAATGILFGGAGASAILTHNGAHNSRVYDISAIDFADIWQLSDVRLIHFEDDSGICSALAACHPINIGTSASSSSFTGDLNFGLGSQFVSALPATSNFVAVINNQNAGTIAGIRFNGVSFYYGQILVGSIGGGNTQDIWFGSGYQLDQAGSVGFNIGAQGSGSLVTNIHIDNGYVFGNTTTATQLIDAFSSTGGVTSEIFVTGNILAQSAAGQYMVQTNGVSGLHLDHNTFRNPRNAGKAVVEFTSCSGCEAIGNTADNQYGTATFQWFFETATMDYYVIANNISNGLAAAGTTVNANVHDVAAGAHSSVQFNW